MKCPECETVFEDGLEECPKCGYEPENYKSIAVLGYVFSFLFPIIGIFIGFYLNTRENRNGKIIMAISLIVLLLLLIIPWASDISLKYYYYY